MRIAAVVTAFHPDERLVAVVDAALESCEEIVVVDNTPGDFETTATGLIGKAGVRVIRSGANLGLAGALNLGVRALSERSDAVLFLDQDSVLMPDLVSGLAVHLADRSIGVAAPAPWDADAGRYYESRVGSAPDVTDRDVVITSGMLVRRSLLGEQPFREDFFVDCVDFDFCLRLRRTGTRIVQDRRLKLVHSLGERHEHRLPAVTLRSSRHPVWRVYWFARNNTILIREHWRDARGWTFGTLLYLVQWFAVRALVEPPRPRRIGAALRGFFDGAFGRTSAAYLPDGASHPAAPAGSTDSDEPARTRA